MQKRSVFVVLAGLSMAVAAHAAVPTRLVGDASTPAMATQTVVLTPTTDTVNVDWGQTVDFKLNNQQFAFDFDGVREASRINLQRVAPAGLLDHPVYAYVQDFPHAR